MKKFIFLISVSLCGCVTTNQVQFSTLTLQVQYVDEKDNPVNMKNLPQTVNLLFPGIPGAIAGATMTEPLYSLSTPINQPFEIKLTELKNNVIPYSTPMLTTEFNSHLTIVPKETKLIRVGTFAFDNNGNFLGPTGIDLLDSDVHQIFLVYFDRPSNLTGYAIEGDTTIEYSIKIERPGFSLLKAVYTNENNLKISEHSYVGRESITIQKPTEKLPEA